GGIDIDAIIRDLDDARLEHRFSRVGKVGIWKMPSFAFDPADADRVIDAAVKDSEALILDLRGNPGGYVKTLEQVIGRFYDHDVTISQMKGRKPEKPSLARKHGRTFSGRIVALVDSRSASAAEIFARVLQLEKRGVVVGDQSSGSVMRAY